MGLKSRLRLISLLPITMLFLLSGYFLYTSYLDNKQTEEIKKRLELNSYLNDVITQVAKERGMTSIYLGSKGKLIKNSLDKQRKVVNNSINRLYNYLKQNPKFQQESKLFLSNLKEIPKIRKKVDELKIDFKKVFFDFYTDAINTALIGLKRFWIHVCQSII